MRLKGFSGACWGYNFDWQSRSFFLPRGMPTIVPTAFAARALCEAAEVFGHDEYLPFARTVCDFILTDLNRTADTDEEMCFSYSPLDQTRVFNASLLAGETLANVGTLTGERTLFDFAIRAARYVVQRQREDGSWTYGADSHQAWSDNFHTAFILTSLSRVMVTERAEREVEASRNDSSPEAGRGPDPRNSHEVVDATGSQKQFNDALRRGYEFWRERFFLEDGWPKYFPDRLYPADAHSAASAIVTLVELSQRLPEAITLAHRIAEWACDNLRDRRGFFYYQRRRFYKVRIPYMRWSEGWTMYALARLLEGKRKKEKGKNGRNSHAQ